MTTTEVTEAIKVNIDGNRKVVLVPSAMVTVSGATVEIKGLLHIVATFAGESAVHYYTILVEEWTAGSNTDEIRQKVERVLAKAKEKAEEYASALRLLMTLNNVEINFRDGLASRNWLPIWLQKYIE